MKKWLVPCALAIVLAPAARGDAQAPEAQAVPTPARAAQRVLGEVTALDAAAPSLTLKTDDARSVVVKPDEKTAYLRAKPGATSLEGATPVTLAEIAVGDRVLARGGLAADGTSLQARQVIVMTRGDITEKQDRERAEWRRRGIVGVITGLDPVTQAITLQMRSFGAAQTLVVDTAEKKAAFRRYAPDSVKFRDARPSSFAELKAGDQLRALGDRVPEGDRFVAEQVVSGSFRTVVGVVDAVNAQAGEIRLTDGESREKLTIVAGSDALLRRLPPEFAQRMAMRRAGAGGEGLSSRSEGQRDEGTQAEAARGEGPREGGEGRRRFGGPGGGGPGAGGPPNLGDLLERMPAITLADLKRGDMIAVSSTRGADPTRLTAIALVSGIEALIPPEPSGPRRAGGGAVDVGLPAGAMDMGMGLP